MTMDMVVEDLYVNTFDSELLGDQIQLVDDSGGNSCALASRAGATAGGEGGAAGKDTLRNRKTQATLKHNKYKKERHGKHNN